MQSQEPVVLEAGAADPSAVPSQPMTVLLIEDSPIIRDGLIELVNAYPNCRIAAATDSEFEAVRELSAHHFDVVIIDLQLKYGTGLGVLRFLQNRNDLLKIVLTNFNSPQMRERCMAAGAHFYLDKSREFDSVVTAIQGWGSHRLEH